MLIVADLHLGKAASFRAAGVPVPEVIHADLELLGVLLDRTGAQDLVIVGDLIHAPQGRTAAVLEPFAAWRRARSELSMWLIRGNHDARAGDPPFEWKIRTVAAPWTGWDDLGVEFVHDPEKEPGGSRPVIGGHLHPAVKLEGPMMSARAECFWLRSGPGVEAMVLPAFGRFTGARCVQAREGDRLFAIGDDEVIEVPGALLAARR